MLPEAAIQQAMHLFPFEGYMSSGVVGGAYLNIAHTASRHLARGAAILDFGCGPCDKTGILQFLGFNCAGYDDLQDDWHGLADNRERVISFARQCGIDFRLAQSGPVPFARQSFDMIMLHDVLEHLHDSPRDLLNDLLLLAKPEGLLFVTVPNAVNIRKRIDVLRGRTNLPPFEGFYWHPGSWRGHVREYVRDDLVQLAEFLGLEILELRGCDHMLQKVPGITRPAYRAVTSVFNSWKDSWTLVARKTPDWTPRKTLPRHDLDRILGRVTSYQYSSTGCSQAA